MLLSSWRMVQAERVANAKALGTGAPVVYLKKNKASVT